MNLSKNFGQGLMLNLFSFWAFGYLACSYLQPGASSFLLKIIVSSLVAIVLVFRGTWRKIRWLISKRSSQKEKQYSPASPATSGSGEEEANL